jgi:hypothetical protein
MGTAVACAVALLIVTIVIPVAMVGSEPALAQEAPAVRKQVVEGMLTCSRCKAKHSAAIGENAADCVRTCAHIGAAFELIDGDNSYRLEGDPSVFKHFAARRVRVVGMVQSNVIRVSSVTAE